jgi:hypothetical protein
MVQHSMDRQVHIKPATLTDLPLPTSAYIAFPYGKILRGQEVYLCHHTLSALLEGAALAL